MQTTVDLKFFNINASGVSVSFQSDGPHFNLPLKFIDFDHEADRGAVVPVTMPEWLATKEGLI